MPKDGKIIYTDAFRQTFAGRIRQDIERIDREIAQTQAELDLVKSMRETLGKIQDVLAQMRALAVESANNPNADRKKMNLRFERMKKRIDLLAAACPKATCKTCKRLCRPSRRR